MLGTHTAPHDAFWHIYCIHSFFLSFIRSSSGRALFQSASRQLHKVPVWNSHSDVDMNIIFTAVGITLICSFHFKRKCPPSASMGLHLCTLRLWPVRGLICPNPLALSSDGRNFSGLGQGPVRCLICLAWSFGKSQVSFVLVRGFIFPLKGLTSSAWGFLCPATSFSHLICPACSFICPT